jgi:hypothetical protein
MAERRYMGWVLNDTPRLLRERDSVLYMQEAGWILYGQDNIAFFGVQTQHFLPRTEMFTDCSIPSRHYHCTKVNHVLCTKLKILCTLYCWFSLDAFFMDWYFNRVKWETLTYLERYQ